jgi:hypothetical protein
MARAFEKRKITLAPERNVERHGHVVVSPIERRGNVRKVKKVAIAV